MHLVIDIGNSRGKLALFQDREMLKHATWKTDEGFDIKRFLEGEAPDATAIASVREPLPDLIERVSERIGEPLMLSANTPLPLRLGLKDPQTIGPDRLANAMAAYSTWPEQSVLVIDMGTCITYEMVEKGVLVGGAISPGVRIRSEAMHRSTGRLPRVELEGIPARIEPDTVWALRSGIHYGVLDEIKGRISALQNDRPNGVVVLTGGDSSLVGKELKKGIFADPFLTLRGLDATLHQHMESSSPASWSSPSF